MLKRLRALFAGRRAKTAKQGPTKPSSRSRPPAQKGPKVVRWPVPSSDLDADAVKIVRRLTRFGHRAYFVGGCVRDLLLERKPKDYDVGTSATPRQMKRLFRNCRIIGRRFRLAHIYFQNGKIIEVATFRALDGQDGPDGQDTETDRADLLIRDDNVFGTPAEDALRRDFTINCLFYDLNDQTVIDHADGLTDLRGKLVRTIGDPDIRFREDPIRILRAIKFAARLGFAIEPETLHSILRNRHELDKAAPPRVLEEINRFGREGAARRSFELLRETKMFQVVFPEVSAAYARDPASWDLMLEFLDRLDGDCTAGRGEVRTGEIFAAILLPVLAPRVGWQADGTVARPGGLNLRGLIDEVLRPMALRLRAPRREQEHCRQILGTLFRMVPARKLRRGVKGAILHRDCLPDALRMLEKIAERLGGDFSHAYGFWTENYKPGQTRNGDATEGARPARSRSRRRKPRRRRREAEEPGEGQPPSTAKDTTSGEESEAAERPQPWHEHSFFAALPSAPEVNADDTKGDRYGNSAHVEDSASTEPPAPPDSSESSSEEPARKPRRRRRRRRRKSASSDRAGEGQSAETPPPAADGGEN